MTATTDTITAETMAETEITNNNQDTNREIRTTQTGMTITKIEIGTTIIKIEIGSTTEGDQTNISITETNTKLKTVRGFINLIKANPTTREQYKSNKLATCKYDNEVNESEIQSSSLEQVQQFFNEDSDIIFDALVAADYIDEIECTDGICQQQA